MDGFAVYLNTNVMQFSKEPSTKYLSLFSDGIATADYVPEGYQYSKFNLILLLKIIYLSFLNFS